MNDKASFWERHPIVSLLSIFLAIGLIGWGIYGIKVAMSPVKGAGDVIIKNQDANNRIQTQEKFEKLYHGIVAIDKNLDVLAATVKAHPNDRKAQDDYNGNVMICHNQVAAYNAEAKKTTSKDWISEDLPFEINDNDPETDCKESNK